eukprot:NODE_5423_length_1016_cov_38.447928_g4854_i0.p1 GENE.NODE_5423_length_1016_cov_38.447928_g4854_i0~~NODE_5423_length_1016_cov_38.447928_g4854_i0.p1  ORF type:complete len:304 (-),score=39.98 NODE_5423_length_1016_cov_38.447928_g4854_i0:105-890(-)
MAICSHSNINIDPFIHYHKKSEHIIEAQEYIQLHIPIIPPSDFYLVFYTDQYLNKVHQIWNIQIHSCPTVRLQMEVGYTNRVSVPIENLITVPKDSTSMDLSCYISSKDIHLDKIQKNSPLVLCHRPLRPCTSLFYLNTILKASQETISTHIIEVQSIYPQPSRRWAESTFPLLGDRKLLRRIPFKNLYFDRRTFSAHTSSPSLLKIHPTSFSLDPSESLPINMEFSNLDRAGQWEIYLFVNTADDDKLEECLQLVFNVVS